MRLTHSWVQSEAWSQELRKVNEGHCALVSDESRKHVIDREADKTSAVLVKQELPCANPMYSGLQVMASRYLAQRPLKDRLGHLRLFSSLLAAFLPGAWPLVVLSAGLCHLTSCLSLREGSCSEDAQ